MAKKSDYNFQIRELLLAGTFVVSCTTDKEPIGTAFCISPGGYLLTAGHLLKRINPCITSNPNNISVYAGWEKNGNNKGIPAQLVHHVFDENEELDYALLKIGPEFMSDITPLFINIGQGIDTEGGAHICGLNGESNGIECFPIKLSGVHGVKNTLSMISSSEITKGFSGAAIYFNQMVIGIQVGEMKARYALPIFRIVKNFPPLINILKSEGCLSEGETENYRETFEIFDKAFRDEVNQRISVLTGGEIKDDHLKCIRQKKYAKCGHSHKLCNVGFMALWMITELKRSKAVITRVQKCLSFFAYISLEANTLDNYLSSEEKFKSVTYRHFYAIKKSIMEIEKEFDKPLESRATEDAGLKRTWHDRLALFIHSRCALPLDDAESLGQQLELIKTDLDAIPTGYQMVNNNLTLTWEDYLNKNRHTFRSNFMDINKYNQVQNNLQAVLDELVENTRKQLKQDFSTVEDGEGKISYSTDKPLEKVFYDAIINLPQNKTSEWNPSLKVWPGKRTPQAKGGYL